MKNTYRKPIKKMPTNIFHLEYSFDGVVEHSYYTSLLALAEDNTPADTAGMVSIHTLQRVKDWPYTRKDKIGGHTVEITIRKGEAYTTTDVRNHNDVGFAEDYE
mgnify:CR=1 FL=1